MNLIFYSEKLEPALRLILSPDLDTSALTALIKTIIDIQLNFFMLKRDHHPLFLVLGG